MAYQKEGKIKVTYQDGQEHEFTAIAACAGLDPEQVVETDEVLSSISSTSEYPVQSKAIYQAMLYKADLVNGTVPASQLPSYVSTIVEVPSYSDLPAQGAGDTIYITTDTNHQYRWAGTRYVDITSENNFVSVPIQNMANMGALRTYIDGINQQGLHCFFDFSAYVENAYVCTVLMFTQNNANYCLIFDIINGRTYLDYNGYQDATTVQEYVSRNEDNLIRTLKITDTTTTMADISAILDKVNQFGHHVMFDVSALNAGAYLCSILIADNKVKVMDVVSQKSVEAAYDRTTLLVTVLAGLDALARIGQVGFKRISAPLSTTLTDGEKENIVGGAHVLGEFLGLKNAVFLAATKVGETTYRGTVIANQITNLNANLAIMQVYTINDSTNKIALVANTYIKLGINVYGYQGLYLHCESIYLEGAPNVYGKYLPNYPSDTTKLYKFQQGIGGNLAWTPDFNQASMTQAEFDQLANPDDNTLYFIPEEA